MAEHDEQLNEGELQKLGDELIDAISGGFIHEQENGRYEIIDDMTGDVIAKDWRYNEYIAEYCERHGVSVKEISDEQLKKLRKYGPIGAAFLY